MSATAAVSKQPHGLVFEPFPGWHPLPDTVTSIASPPYDVISSREAADDVKNNPLSFLRIIKPEICTPPSGSVYETGRENLENAINKGWFIQDNQPVYYLYSQQVGTRTQYGFVGAASCSDYSNGHIKKHELTREAKETDRFKLISAHKAQVGPVLLTFSSNALLESLIKEISSTKPYFTFVPTKYPDQKHSLWIISDESLIASLRSNFQSLDSFYIADGHHRSAAALRYHQTNPNSKLGNHFLAVAFPDSQLSIVGYHRLVRNGPTTTLELLESLTKNGWKTEKIQVENLPSYSDTSPRSKKPFLPSTKGVVTMYTNGSWFRLIRNDSSEDQDLNHRSNSKQQENGLAPQAIILDVSILTDTVLRPIFSIGNLKTDPNIGFVGGDTVQSISSIKAKVDSGEYHVGFIMFPLSVQELKQVSDQNQLLAPKSTFFYPKLQSGVVFRTLSE